MGFVSDCLLFVLFLASARTAQGVLVVFQGNKLDFKQSTCALTRPTKPSEVKRMYNNSFISDIQFTFGNNNSGEVFYAHKYVLAISSRVFKEMFYNQTRKAVQTIHLPDYNSKAIEGFFGFIYKEECPTDYEKDLDVLRLIKYYEIISYDAVCSTLFQRNAEVQNNCKFLDVFLEVKAKALAEICLDRIDLYAEEYFASEYFLEIKQSTLLMVLNRDTLGCNETDIFKAVVQWADRQCSNQNLKSTRENRRMVLGDAIYSIRFLLMSQTEFTSHVLPTDILDNDEIVAILRTMSGEQVAVLGWDSVKLRTERRSPEQLTTSALKGSSFTHIIELFVSEYFVPLIYYLIFGLGICACIGGGLEIWKNLSRR